MADSFIQTIDNGMKTFVFNRFASYLGLENENKGIVFAPKEIAQRKIAEKRGESSVEFISIWRNGIVLDWKRQQTPIGKQGITLTYVDSTTKEQLVIIKGIPALIDYDVYIWSRDLDKIAKSTQAYIEWLHANPQLVLYYDGSFPMEMYLRLGHIEDASDYDIYAKGQYFVSKFNLQLDAWILTSINTKTILTIIIDLYSREGEAGSYRDTLLREYTIEATV